MQRRNFTLASILFSLLLSLCIEIFITSILFPMVDSLVRVARRDKWNYFQFDVSVRLSIALFDRRLKNRQQYASCVGIDGLDQLFNDTIPRTICEVIADDYLSENLFNEFTNRIKRSGGTAKYCKVCVSRATRPTCRARQFSLTFIYFLWFGFRY